MEEIDRLALSAHVEVDALQLAVVAKAKDIAGKEAARLTERIIGWG
jgi:hypothetical protein